MGCTVFSQNSLLCYVSMWAPVHCRPMKRQGRGWARLPFRPSRASKSQTEDSVHLHAITRCTGAPRGMIVCPATAGCSRLVSSHGAERGGCCCPCSTSYAARSSHPTPRLHSASRSAAGWCSASRRVCAVGRSAAGGSSRRSAVEASCTHAALLQSSRARGLAPPAGPTDLGSSRTDLGSSRTDLGSSRRGVH